ncbi:MAG: 30S ribosomal protein S2 [Deltaproteobacteria bacterium]|nr:MAG: 30S ribosomal protein S2 [Deltaproteobacteria bacterium]
MSEMSVKEMLEAGVHFGHQTHRWNPRMKPYIYGSRNGIHIIDLQKTAGLSQQAYDYIRKSVAKGGTVLFVGTKKQAQPIIIEESKRAQMFSVSHRWLGGTLTNFKTIQASIDRLKTLEKKKEDGSLEVLTKKERLMADREIEKLTESLGGIKDMPGLPSVIFVIDPSKEDIALKEASRLGIKVVAVADTNCNPEGIDFLIPGNDDALKSIRYFTQKMADACLEGLSQRQAVIRDRVEDESSKKSFAPREKTEAATPTLQ